MDSNQPINILIADDDKVIADIFKDLLSVEGRTVETCHDGQTAVEKLQEKYHDFVIEFRQLGLMMGLVFKGEMSGQVVSKTAYDNDLLMVYANNDPSACQLLPPLTMNRSDMALVSQRLDRAVAQARAIVLGT